MSGMNYSILIVDDDITVIQSTRVHLERLAKEFGDKIKIYQAKTGIRALSIISEYRIDVIFLDYHFKTGVSGDDIIDKIEDPFNNLIIILMSAYEPEILAPIVTKRHRHLGSRFKFLKKYFGPLQLRSIYLEIELFFTNYPAPYPLAYAQKAFFASSTIQEKIATMKDVIESIAKYSVAILMSDIFHQNAVNSLIFGDVEKQEWNLKTWLNQLEYLIGAFQTLNKPAFMPELLQVFEEHNKKHLIWMNQFAEKIEDVGLGYGYARDEGWYNVLFEEYSESLISLMENYRFISRYILLVPEKVNSLDKSGNLIEYSCRFLMGAEVKFSLKSLRYRHLRLNKVYLFRSRKKHVSLHPFIIYAFCTQCFRKHLYLVSKMQPKEVEYTSTCNSHIRNETDKDFFDMKIDTKLKNNNHLREERRNMTSLEQWFAATILKDAIPFLFDEARKILAERRQRRQELSKPEDNSTQSSHVKETEKEEILNLEPVILNEEIQKDIDSYLKQIQFHNQHRRIAEEKIAAMGGINYVTPPIRYELNNAEDEIIKSTKKLKVALENIYGQPIHIDGLD